MEDFGSYIPKEEFDKEHLINYKKMKPFMANLPGVSVFVQEDDKIYHTYSSKFLKS
jgi:predicted dithiol-disulfide oxidoreductase (DUF899 family)